VATQALAAITGKTQYLQERWATLPADTTLIWVENAQSVRAWVNWQQQQYPERPLHIGTIRAWPRRWVQTYLSTDAPLHLPSVLGAQWLMGQVLATHPAWSQAFWDMGWNKTRLVRQLVRWSIQSEELLTPLPALPLSDVITEILAAYRTLAWQKGILDYGQQLRVVREYLLTNSDWITTVATQFPHWIADDLQEWLPAHIQMLQTFEPTVDLHLAYNPQFSLNHSASWFAALPTVTGPPAPKQAQIDQLYGTLTAAPGVSLTGVERHWVKDRRQLWDEAVLWVAQLLSTTPANEIVLLIPQDDAVLHAQMTAAFTHASIAHHWFFPERELGLPAQLVWTALKWRDAATWGSASIYETAQFLELGLGLSSGQALTFSRTLHQPLWEPDAITPAPVWHFYRWQRAANSDTPRALWDSLFQDLLADNSLTVTDQHRLTQLAHWGQEILTFGTLADLRLLQGQGGVPRWELPIPTSAVLITSPSYFAESHRTSRHQLWLDVTAATWGYPATPDLGTDPKRIRALQYCLLRNQDRCILFATPLDDEGQRQQGSLARLMST
jgi:hypothetical protein